MDKVHNKDTASKIYWPKAGYSKQDLIDYYQKIASYILPHLKDRPLVLKRFPKGITGTSFFQKNVKGDLPTYVKTVSIPTKDHDKEIHYIVCNNKETLEYLGHLAVIEIHPWSSRIENVRCPDYMIFDLDPGPKTHFADVVEVACILHNLLSEAGLINVCKTSGKRGLHIYVPLYTPTTYTKAREQALRFAEDALKKHPDLISLEHWPEKRQDKVYIDIFRNSYGQTTVAPYSPRAIEGASVSTPLMWEEVTKDLNPHDFTIKTIFTRLKLVGDLWKKEMMH